MKKQEDTPREKRSAKLASADTMPAGVLDPATARYTVSDTMPIPEVPEPSLPPGERDSERISRMPSGMHERGKLGRFDILDVLGQGGMGVVVAAYDPQLDRKVAIKVLRTKGLTGKRREKEAARLLREARTMAQLSHPHVVTVYEAGEIDDRVFIAMEYIPGQTLRSWLDEKPRTVLEILDAYTKAGRGLAAGHTAGLIHRDFKPDNVLVGFDGRVRVIDFGLARPTRANDHTPSPQDDSLDTDEISFSGLHLQLTTAGSLFGTPIYMSPEQHNKLRLDGQSDQFSFCVALYEALYQALPFEGGSYAELASNVTEGKIRQPPEQGDIPKRVVDAILRGLRVDPDERFPTMDALLDELAPTAKQVNRWVLIGLGGIAAISVALVVVLLASRGDDKDRPCLDGPQRLVGVWDDAVKAKIKTAFKATGRTHADETYKRVVETLDAYAAKWVVDRREICEATKVRDEVSETLFDVRMRCVTDRLAELGAITTELVAADPQVVDRSTDAARDLRSSTKCVTWISSATPPTAAQQVRIDKLSPELLKLMTNNELGRYDVAVRIGDAISGTARDLDYPVFACGFENAYGLALSGANRWVEAEKAFRSTLERCAAAKEDKLSASAWSSLITAIGQDAKRHDEALALTTVAELAIQRADNEARLRGQLHYAIGGVQLAKGNYEQAVKAFEAGLALPPGGLTATNIVAFNNALGHAHLRSSNIMGARDAFKNALAASRKAYAEGHPDIAFPLSSLGMLAQAMANWDDATTYHTQALKILEETRGPDHEQTTLLVYSLAISANGREDFKAALPLYQRALASFEKLSPTHLYVGLSLIGVADCLEELGDPAPAVIAGERALAMMATAQDPVQLAMARFILAKALWAANQDKPRAKKLATEARAGFKAGGLGAIVGLAAVEKWFMKIEKK